MSRAIELADWCDANSSGIYRKSSEAVAELRRLDAVTRELLDALRLADCVLDAEGHPKSGPYRSAILAAIAKATDV